jgi:hypothetical protein
VKANSLPSLHGLKLGMSYAQLRSILPTVGNELEVPKIATVHTSKLKNSLFSDVDSIDFDFFTDKVGFIYIQYKKSKQFDSVKEQANKLSDFFHIPISEIDISYPFPNNGGAIRVNCDDFILEVDVSNESDTQTRYLRLLYVGRNINNVSNLK